MAHVEALFSPSVKKACTVLSHKVREKTKGSYPHIFVVHTKRCGAKFRRAQEDIKKLLNFYS